MKNACSCFRCRPRAAKSRSRYFRFKGGCWALGECRNTPGPPSSLSATPAPAAASLIRCASWIVCSRGLSFILATLPRGGGGCDGGEPRGGSGEQAQALVHRDLCVDPGQVDALPAAHDARDHVDEDGEHVHAEHVER